MIPSRASIETVKAVPKRRLVALGHRLQAELVAAFLGQAEADQPAAVRGHEVDRLGRRELRRDRQVALVLAVGGVDDDHELAVADVLDRLLDGGEGGGAVGRVHLAVDRNPQAEASRSAYFASRSTSTLTSSPGPSAPRVVCSSVNGTSATSNAVVVEGGDRQRDAVDRERALLDAVAV